MRRKQKIKIKKKNKTISKLLTNKRKTLLKILKTDLIEYTTKII